MVLKPEAFQQWFHRWTAAVFPPAPEGRRRRVAVDGKTCRGSPDAGNNPGPLHIVSARASEEGISPGQVATAAKSDEITAIPAVPAQIDRSNALVTIDAMGRQKAVAAQSVEAGGDDVIAATDNRPKLAEAVGEFFREAIQSDLEEIEYHHSEVRDSGRGRSDIRSYSPAKMPENFARREHWPSIKALGYALRETRHDDGRPAGEIRYHISSRCLSGKRYGEAVRQHWGIESMPWVLDVNFREDDSRTRDRTLGNNLSWLRRFAVGLLKGRPKKDSICGKMVRCGIRTAFLTEVLLNQGV